MGPVCHFHRLVVDEMGMKRTSIKAVQDKSGLFWTVTIRANGVTAVTTLAKKPDINHPKVQRIVRGLKHKE